MRCTKGLVLLAAFALLSSCGNPIAGLIEEDIARWSDATLAACAISSGPLSPAFDPKTTSYTATSSGASITVTPTKAQKDARVEVRVNTGSWSEVPSGSASGSLGLSTGDNTVEIRITAGDGATTSSYLISVYMLHGNADLSALSVDAETLYPSFSPETAAYLVVVPGGTASVTVTLGADSKAGIEVQVNGGPWQAVPAGIPSPPLGLNPGDNPVAIRVTAENETQKSYTLTVTPRTGGVLDPSFLAAGSGADAYVHSLAVQQDGRILIGGGFTLFNGVPRGYVARLDPDGSLDAGFGASGLGGSGLGADNPVLCIHVQPDGKIIVGGGFTVFNGSPRGNLARLDADGSLDAGFLAVGSGANNFVGAIETLSNGMILVGGYFTAYQGAAAGGLARLNTDGTFDAGFNPGGSGADAGVLALAVQLDGKIVIGGSFTSFNGTARGGLARLEADGRLDTGFDPSGAGTNGSVYCIALLPDGKILIGGSFTSYDGTARNRVARLNSDGSLDPVFAAGGSGANGAVHALAVQADGRILVGGYFTAYDGTARNRAARLNADGSLDGSFLAMCSGADDLVYSLGVQPDGKVLLAGYFRAYNGIARAHVARTWGD